MPCQFTEGHFIAFQAVPQPEMLGELYLDELNEMEKAFVNMQR